MSALLFALALSAWPVSTTSTHFRCAEPERSTPGPRRLDLLVQPVAATASTARVSIGLDQTGRLGAGDHIAVISRNGEMVLTARMSAVFISPGSTDRLFSALIYEISETRSAGRNTRFYRMECVTEPARS